MKLTYASVCSGIEAASVAWHPLGWEGQFVSEIEPFPCALLAHHWPKLPNYGNMLDYEKWKQHRIDVLVGGTPCQAFSVAGLRKGLADPRGNLTLTYLALVAKYQPRWVVWENVPGVLSDKTGAFGAFLGGLGQLGYGFAYRILDAQYFGVAQRRRRVFVVAHIGGLWQRAAAVLFERESLCGNTPPRRQSRQGTAHTLSARTKGGGGLGTDFDCDGGCIPIQEIGKRQSGTAMNGVGHGKAGDPMYTLQSAAVHGVLQPIGIDGGEVGYALRATASHSGDKGDGGVNCTMVVCNDARAGRMRGREGCAGGGKGPLLSEEKSLTLAVNANDQVLFQQVAHSLRADGFDASEDGTGRGTPLVPECSGPITAGMSKGMRGTEGVESNWMVPEVVGTLSDGAHNGGAHNGGGLNGQDAYTGRILPTATTALRRLTPREYERLQGFPDDYTLVSFRSKPAADGPRYKALGNSMAVPVMAWIGKRIEMVEEITS